MAVAPSGVNHSSERIEVQREAQAARPQLLPQLRDPSRQRPLDGERQVRHPRVQELFVWLVGPVGRAASAT